MQAIRVHEFGGPDVLKVEEVATPTPGEDELLIRVMAAGVGPWDISLRDGGYTGSIPYTPGGEFAGLVEGGTGEFASFDDGTPVYGYPGLTGCYAQYVTCPVEQLAPIPQGLSITDAAAVPIDALTAEQGLTDELNVAAGDHVLITAGAAAWGTSRCRSRGRAVHSSSRRRARSSMNSCTSWGRSTSSTTPGPTGPNASAT